MCSSVFIQHTNSSDYSLDTQRCYCLFIYLLTLPKHPNLKVRAQTSLNCCTILVNLESFQELRGRLDAFGPDTLMTLHEFISGKKKYHNE